MLMLMRLPGKVRETVDRVTSAAADTRQAIMVLGALAVTALAVALVALLLASRRRRA